MLLNMSDLARAAAAFQRATRRVDETRAELHAAILRAVDEGVPQVEIVEVTGYTRERIRQLAREAGLTP